MNPFWNREQKRLRAFWRILIQGLFYFLGTFIFGIIISLIQFFVLVLQGKLNLDLLNDPGQFSQLINGGGGAFVFLTSGFASVVVVVVSFFLAGRFLDKRRFVDFGFHFSRKWWQDFSFGLFLGAFLMTLIFLAEWAMQWVEITSFFDASHSMYPFIPSLFIGIFHYIFVGINEEMLFRGYYLRNLAEGFNFKVLGARGGVWMAYLLSSSIFGLMHIWNPNANLISTLNIVIAGLFLGLAYVLTGELAIPIGLHITWNFFQGNVFGFPVSGSRTASSFIQIQQHGPNWMTGGVFGPEAGILGILALIIGSGLILYYVRRRYGISRLKEDLAIYRVNPEKDMPVDQEEKQEFLH